MPEELLHIQGIGLDIPAGWGDVRGAYSRLVN